MTGAAPLAPVAVPRVAALGDAAITITLGDVVSRPLHDRVRALAERIRAVNPPGVEEVVAAYAAVTVYYDPLHVSYEALAEQLRGVLPDAGAEPANDAGTEHHIAVRYDGADLEWIAERTGLNRAEVIARHAAPMYHVYLVGFVPGFAYLGDLDPLLAVPRRAEPRRRVLAGSVAIAGSQTAVYPAATPGGWHLIGRTEIALFDPARSPSALLQVGDRVRFMDAGS